MLTSRRHRWIAALILLISGAFNFTAIDYGQPAHYDQAVDGLHPVFALDALRHTFGERSQVGLKYPRLHYLVTGAAERAWLFVRYGADESAARVDRMLALFDRAGSMPPDVLRRQFAEQADAIGELNVVGRCVAAAYGILLVWTMMRFTRRFASDLAALIAGALTATSYPVVYYAHTLNVDVPYMTLGLLALDQAVAAIQTGRTRPMIWMGVFAALAGATKDQVYGWFVFTIPVILWLLARPGALGQDGPRRPFPWRGVAIALPIAAVTYLLAFGVPWDMRAFHVHFDHIFGDGVDPFREFHGATGHVQLQAQIGQHLGDAMGWVLPWVSVFGLVVAFRRLGRGALLILVPAISYDATFIAPIGYCYLRFTIPILLMLLVAAAIGFAAIAERSPAKWFGIAALAFVLQAAGAKSWGMLELMRDEPWTPATRWIETNIEPTAFAVTSFDLPLHNIDPPRCARVVQRRYGDPLPPDLGVPDWIVMSVFETPRTILEVTPPRAEPLPVVPAFGTHYELAAKFGPQREHPIRRGAAFQPHIAIYRRVKS